MVGQPLSADNGCFVSVNSNVDGGDDNSTTTDR